MRVTNSEKCVLVLLSIVISVAAFVVDSATEPRVTTTSLGPKRTSGSPHSIANQVNYRLVRSGQPRSRRSILDKAIKSARSVDFNTRKSVQPGSRHARDLSHDLYPLRNLDFSRRDLSNFNQFPSNLDSVFKAQQFRMTSADRLKRTLADDVGSFDAAMFLPSTMDIAAPVAERAKAEADALMEEFLNYLELRASGILGACLQSVK